MALMEANIYNMWMCLTVAAPSEFRDEGLKEIEAEHRALLQKISDLMNQMGDDANDVDRVDEFTSKFTEPVFELLEKSLQA